MSAPSAVTKDPWHFVVVRDLARRKALGTQLSNGSMLEECSLALVVCGDLRRAHEKDISFLLQDCAAATQNFMLAAVALSLGTCWLSVHPRAKRIDFVRQTLNLPEEIIPVAVLAVGRPAERIEPRCRFREEAVHHETW